MSAFAAAENEVRKSQMRMYNDNEQEDSESENRTSGGAVAKKNTPLLAT